MPRVVHFEINADNPERAAAFYSETFGWRVNNWGGPVDYWLIASENNNEPGIEGAIKHRSENLTTVNTISVPSVDDYIKKIERNGGKVLTPKMAIPGIGYHAYAQDTEGNVFGLLENNPSAQ